MQTCDITYTKFNPSTLIALILLVVTNSLSAANNNKYGADDDLYDQFVKLDRVGLSLHSVKMADSLSLVAAERGDVAGECIFLSIPVKYYSRQGDLAKFTEACDRLQNISLTGGKNTENWYFWTFHQQALYFINHDQFFKALDVASLMRETAERRHSNYGIFKTMEVVGDIYRIRNDIGLSGENYLKAYEYKQKFLPEHDDARLCAYIGEYYRRKSGRTQADIEKSAEFVELGLSLAKDDQDRAALLNEKAMSLYSERNVPAFYDVYKQCQEVYSNIGEDADFLQVKYRKCILDKNFSRAIEIADSMPSEYDRQIALYVINRAFGNYEAALKNYEKANHSLNLIREQERRGDLSEINGKLGNYQLEITNSSLLQERSRTINAALIVICLIIIIALVVLVRFIRKIRRTNIQLANNNEELVAARKKAEESDKMKMVFIQNMSHEIRTPLNAIVGFSNLLAYNNCDFTPEEIEEFRKLINHNCDMLTILIDDILTISDIESGKYVFDFTDTPINHTCMMALESAVPRAKTGVELKFNSSFDDNYTVNTDNVRLTQVLNNVLVNACIYTSHGSISIDVKKSVNNKVQISVSDTGPGIPADKAEVIFERFTKLDRFKQGTGLGLNICKMIMDRLKGCIYLDTAYTAGARFVIEIP